MSILLRDKDKDELDKFIIQLVKNCKNKARREYIIEKLNEDEEDNSDFIEVCSAFRINWGDGW